MSPNEKEDRPKREIHGPRVHRRRFLIWSGLAALGAACNRLLTDSTDASKHRAERLQEFVNYPTPTYLPPEYAFWKEDDNRPDGFRDAGRQTALVYRGPRPPKSIDFNPPRFPLMFFAAKGSSGTLAGTEQAAGTECFLHLPNSAVLTAIYFDGIWEPVRAYDAKGNRVPGKLEVHWSRSNLHAMVYKWGEFQIGMRASRLCGVSFEEMVKIASSVTTPV
jgi:hypothetical protein